MAANLMLILLGCAMTVSSFPDGADDIHFSQPLDQHDIGPWLRARRHVEDRDPLCIRREHRRKLTDKTIHIAVLVPLEEDEKNSPYSYWRVLPAVELAVNHLRSNGLKGPLAGWNITLHYRNTNCSSTYGPLAAVDLHFSGLADIFLGPVCEYVLSTVTRFATVWDKPVLTPGGHPQAFNFKENYKTLTRLRGFHSEVGRVVKSLADHFNWGIVGVLYEDVSDSEGGHSTCMMTLSEVHKAFNKTTKNRSYVPCCHDLKEVIQYFQDKARILVLCAQNQKVVRQIMLTSHEIGMTNGKFAFINIDLYSGVNESAKAWYDAEDKENNEKAKLAFESLITITAMTPTTNNYQQFSNDVHRIAEKKFNYSYPSSEVLLNPYVASFYEAVMVYARAFNKSLLESRQNNFPRGTDVLKYMWNNTEELITGNVSINENGDRNADYSILDLHRPTSKYQVVGVYQRDKLEMLKPIHWPSGSPPQDRPECGFKGELCENYLFLLTVATLVGLVICMAGVSVFIYRHYKLEADIARMTWRVDVSDVIDTSSGAIKKGKRGSRLSIRSFGSAGSGDSLLVNRQMFISTGLYKGTPVAIKRFKLNKIDLTRPLLLELKQMKDLQSEHLVHFVGASLEPDCCAFFTEYCPRGSLQDVLEDDNIKLDDMFRYSLMHDIVKGMLFLHTSEIRIHGKLKSTNCVVDSRFVLKLTDFGLHQLRTLIEDYDPDGYSYYRRLLWTAPEILRSESRPTVETMQKADVYSYAIIVHEIVVRKGPFCTHDFMEPFEIVERVRNGGKALLRPNLDESNIEEEVVQMMKKCWAEDPLDRPDFRHMKGLVRKLNKGNDSGNILDNLLSRMEQYANNLESLVQERTADYLEEKRKCEELLYQLLPKSVARQLITGSGVIAETYDAVTIYFSDIVGFTSLSAQSTPMQVIDLLNDLYSTFDSTIEDFDVYKVETIGDAYMVVSGLPDRNGYLHAREVCRMALRLLESVKKFKIRHRPNERIKLRIGIHSGPCVAGVVGVKMPRYCLFGDTVNTASRMESNGQPLRIHISEATRNLLVEYFPTFDLELRGQVEMKGKGLMTTFWLNGENEDQPIVVNQKKKTILKQATITEPNSPTEDKHVTDIQNHRNINICNKNNKSISSKNCSFEGIAPC